MFKSSYCVALIVLQPLVGSALLSAETNFFSHPPMRPLPSVAASPLATGPKLFVDAVRGLDTNAGSEQAPWKSLHHAFRQLKPGDTLYLRGGVYYEHPHLSRSGTTELPITIAGYPGELAIIDGGLREFVESPATSWEPFAEGAEGEFVSTKSYPRVDDRQVPHQFLPGSWEPMWGIENERPIALGNFADSMIPLHGYRVVGDMRAASELWGDNKKAEPREPGPYCGPGLWFNRETGRVHVRLAHNQLEGLGDRAYRGVTDPRKIPLVIALGFGDDVLRISGIKHVRVRDLVLRGATGSPMVHVYGSENIELDHLSIYGGFPGLLVNASKNIRLMHSAFRGLAAPWTGRGHMKYRGTASYQIVFQNNQPANENIEIASCEFTDDHDFAFFRFVKNLQFHHNFVDNFNDDGLECGPKLRDHAIYIYQNRIDACLGIFQQHENDKDESPLDHNAKAGVFIYRNVIDSRAGVYYGMPTKPDPSGEFLRAEGVLVGDHGGPVWPVMHFYQNTVLRRTPVLRDYFLCGLGAMAMRNTERDVFNNIFVQMTKAPGVGFAGVKDAGDLREGGNVLWGLKQDSKTADEMFVKFRASPMFAQSRKFFEAGWTTQDRVDDPKFVRLPAEGSRDMDLRLQATSPAINAGLPLPSEWPDPLRDADAGLPDAGAMPLGAKVDSVGIDGRIPLFGEIVKRLAN